MPESAAAPLALGQRLGKYLLTDKLGEGGMGVVFGGLHEGLGRQVAIKVLRGEFAKHEQVVQRFQQEAEAVSRIGHANIVAVYDFGHLPDGSLFYVMERIRGETMTVRMRRQPPMTPEEIVSLFAQICRALQATHSRNIVHRDLKPDNVMLVTQSSGLPHVKVVDFGVAKMRDINDPNASKLTTGGTLLGTPTYMAPEQITTPLAVDARADIYSLGAMLFEALTGTRLFTGEMTQVLLAHVKEQPPPPSTRTTTRFIPPALDKMVLRALSKNPADRQQDCNTFATELEAAFGLARRSTGGGRTASGALAPVQHSALAMSAPTAIATAEEAAAALAVVAEAKDSAALTTTDAAAPPTVTPAPTPSSATIDVNAARKPSRAPLFIGLAVVVLGGGAVVVAMTHGKPRVVEPAHASSNGNGTASSTQAPQVAQAPLTPLQIEADKTLATALGGDAQQRRAALDAIADVADRDALDQVITGLGDDNPEVRRAAAYAAMAIGKPDDAGLRRALLEASQRSGGAVAVDLAAARFYVGDATAEEELKRALEMRDPTARLRAAMALASKDKVPLNVLMAALAGAPPTLRRAMRWQAYSLLQKLGAAPFIAQMQAALDGKDTTAALDAAQALARGGDSHAQLALATIAAHGTEPIDRVDAASVLAEMHDVGGIKALTEALASPQPVVRARAATSLGRLSRLLPDRAAIESQLSPMLKDAELLPRVAAASALLAMGEAAPPTPRKP